MLMFRIPTFIQKIPPQNYNKSRQLSLQKGHFLRSMEIYMKE